MAQPWRVRRWQQARRAGAPRRFFGLWIADGAGRRFGRCIDPADGRYVDDKNEPLTGDRLRTAIKSDQPADAFLAVAKRMPMRMRVRMNVLKLPLFLCEFAKSNLPVEVRQVRINAPAGSGRGATGGGSSGSSGSLVVRRRPTWVCRYWGWAAAAGVVRMAWPASGYVRRWRWRCRPPGMSGIGGGHRRVCPVLAVACLRVMSGGGGAGMGGSGARWRRWRSDAQH